MIGFSSCIFEALVVGFCDVFDDTASSSSRNKVYIMKIIQPRRSYKAFGRSSFYTNLLLPPDDVESVELCVFIGGA